MRAHLSELGLSEGFHSPPLYRLLWRLGINAPPPLFSSFGAIAFVQGSLFGVCWGAIMWVALWSRTSRFSWQLALGVSLLAGVLFGAWMAFLVRRRAKQLGLPLWRDYHGSQ